MKKWEKECCKEILEETRRFAKTNNLTLSEALFVRQLNLKSWIHAKLDTFNRESIGISNLHGHK